VGRALKELGIEMIPACSPQVRGRSEWRFGTWQGRLPQELRLAGIATLEDANRFLRKHYIGEMNQKLSVPAAQPENAFVPVQGQGLERIFSLQHERVVAKDNTVRLGDRSWQIERTAWRGTLAGCRVTLCDHLEGEVSIVYGPHVVGCYTAQGEPLGVARKRSEGWQRAAPEGVRLFLELTPLWVKAKASTYRAKAWGTGRTERCARTADLFRRLLPRGPVRCHALAQCGGFPGNR
jgi:hypothetical protein